jgi:acyl-CoA synthetase (AMP-forming)/AMP-acid ligase II
MSSTLTIPQMRFSEDHTMDEPTIVQFSTLLELLQYRAGDRSSTREHTAFTYMDDGEQVSGSLTFRELNRQARSIAAHLQRVTTPGDRALLVYPPSPDYIVAFFGCMGIFAGASGRFDA